MSIKDKISAAGAAVGDTGARVIERIQTVQIAPGGIGLMQIIKLIGILAIALSLAYMQGCRNGTADLRAEMERSNVAITVLEKEGKIISVADRADRKRLEAENAKLKVEIEASRRRRLEVISNPSCGSCTIDPARFPRGMRASSDPTSKISASP